MDTRSPGGRRWRGAAAAAALAVAGAAWAADWLPIASDGIHDPESPGLRVLQEPAEALGGLPRDTAGNKVDWMRALERGLIRPRSNIDPGTTVRLRTTEVLLKNTSNAFMVRFPHRQHTAWIDCVSCHDGLFEMKAGATRLNMLMILSGEKCGQCHGAVAFPLTECARCHSVARGSAAAAAFGTGLVRDPGPP
jgi:c(7)-type cytochrome triheme protein